MPFRHKMTNTMPNSNYTARRPKGHLALFTAFSFTGASILASIIFSLLLFLSLDDNLGMKLLFGGLAVIFELGKFFAWYEFGERSSHKNHSGACVALVFYAVLAAISIGGSIGGINSATNTITQQASIETNRTSSYNLQIKALDDQIALNNQAAQRYIELDRLATGLSRIQDENQSLQAQIMALSIERDALPATRQGSVLGLIEGLATSLNVSAEAAKLGLVVFLSVLLDLFAAFFISLLGEELRFRHAIQRQTKPVVPSTTDIDTTKSIDTPEAGTTEAMQHDLSGTHQQPEPKQTVTPNYDSSGQALGHHPKINISGDSFQSTHDDGVSVADEELVDIQPQYDGILKKVSDKMQSGEIPCQKKAVIHHFSLSQDQVDRMFEQFLNDGWVARKPNHHYVWLNT